MDDSDKDLGTVFVREAGCGVIYALCIEDREEVQYEIDLDREQAEKLFVILAKMLAKNAVPPPVPVALSPSSVTTPPWVKQAVTYPPNYPQHPGWQGISTVRPWFGIQPPPYGW